MVKLIFTIGNAFFASLPCDESEVVFVPLHQVQCLPKRLVMAASLEIPDETNPLVGCWTDPAGDMWVNLFIANRNVIYVNSKKETGYKVTSVYNGQLWCKTIINAPITGSHNRSPSFEKFLSLSSGATC